MDVYVIELVYVLKSGKKYPVNFRVQDLAEDFKCSSQYKHIY